MCTKMFFHTQRCIDGLTLVEVLIVIAIIGILASTVIHGVADARPAAQQAKTLTSMHGIQSAAIYCVDGGQNLHTPDMTDVVCVGQGNWPGPLGDGWSYGDAGTCAFDGDVSDNAFMYCATDGTTVIACTESGCSTS